MSKRNATTPNENTSLAAVIVAPRSASSGAMYDGVPEIAPVRVSCGVLASRGARNHTVPERGSMSVSRAHGSSWELPRCRLLAMTSAERGTIGTALLVGLLLAGFTAACSSDDPAPGAQPAAGSSGVGGSGAGVGGSGAGAGGTGIGVGGSGIEIDGGGIGGNAGNAGTGGRGPYMLPEGFTKTDFGGYKLGDPFNAGTPPSNPGDKCGTTIVAVVRDFKGMDEPAGHPDFQAFDGKGPTLGMVPVDLGADSKPGYTGICEAGAAGGACKYQQQTTSATNFSQWYNYTADVNKPYVLYLSLEPNLDVYTFQSDFFFPLDNTGWGNFGKAQDKKEHNFNFTTELHTEFKYNGGEKFTFIGDDDVWVFVNKRLAVDLGGLHPPETGTVLLDERAAELGITPGNSYTLDLFHAERHTNASHFRVDTNLQFTNCGTFVPDTPR